MSPFAEKKEALLRTFRQNQQEKGAFSLQKTTSNLFRNRSSSKHKRLDVKNFNQVLSIDPIQKIADVEAMITYEDLVNATLKVHCLPPVVPELKTITVGGALVGLGIESSSFRYGLVHESILEIEVLTGDGRVLICTKDNAHRDLFLAFPNSYGTLGIALRVKMRLIPAKAFIKLKLLRFEEEEAFFQKMQSLCEEHRTSPTPYYIDGVIFGPKEQYLILGEPVDEAPYTSNYKYLNIYYQSIRHKKEDFLTTLDYIWRWDPDWFWCSKHFGMQNKWLRAFFGKWMLHSKTYWKIKHMAFSNPLFKALCKLFEKPSESVIQDILIPIHNAPCFADFLHKTVGITPIWICPYFPQDTRYTLVSWDSAALAIDFGFWDIVPSQHPPGYYNRLIEQKTKELQGYKSLYSDSYYSEEEFWQIHPKQTFFQLKEKYDPQKSFRTLFEKVCQR